MCFRVGKSIWKCMAWSQNTKPGSRLVWRVKLRVSLEVNRLLIDLIVLDVEFCKTKTLLRSIKFICEMKI
jgi:hypothetical protein